MEIALDRIVSHYTNLSLIDIKKCYSESHRYYHTWEHIENIFNTLKIIDLTDEEILAILFHDIVYDPRKEDNEENSVWFLKKHWDLNYENELKIISDLIMFTKNHIGVNSLIKADNKILNSAFFQMLDWEHKIFKEYQFCPLDIYIKKRIKFLNSVKTEKNENEIIELINYITSKTYHIGIYAGSFNPFHVGHYDVLKQAEKICDKVVIAQGINKAKANELNNFSIQKENSNILKYYETTTYYGLLTDFILDLKNLYKNINIKFTLIRGIRDSKDFEEERKLCEWLKSLNPNISVCYIISKPEYTHISSSAIREIQSFNSEKAKKYII
jgi:pantetheine-phosphate adenylyltransferase